MTPAPTWTGGQGTSLQNGVLTAADAALSATSVNASTGVLTYTLAAAYPLWIKHSSGIMVAVNYGGAAGATIAPASLPATGQYRGYGLEVDTTGAVTLNAGTNQATQAAALANINTIAGAGKARVADVILLNTAGSYSLPATRDRRPWARGFYNRVRRTTNATLAGIATDQVIDATNLQIRAETVTGMLRCTLRASWTDTAAGNIDFSLFIDGAKQTDVEDYRIGMATAAVNQMGTATWEVTTPLAAGSHLIAPAWANPNGSSTVTLLATSTPTQGISFTVEEIIRQNANNGTS